MINQELGAGFGLALAGLWLDFIKDFAWIWAGLGRISASTWILGCIRTLLFVAFHIFTIA